MVLKKSLVIFSSVKRAFYPALCVPFLGRIECISLLHSSAILLQEEDLFPVHESSKNYKKPVDWLPFPWHRRPKFNIYEKSGDLVKTVKFDPCGLKPDFELSEELKTASEDVKRLFTLENASKTERKEAYRRELLRRVQRHPHDLDSLEAQIALKTVQVRGLFDHGRFIHKKEKYFSRTVLAIIIQKRNKLLNNLRKIDYDRYCWVKEQLELNYEPDRLVVNAEKYCKKWDLRRMTKEYCSRVVKEKKAAYHEELKKQQIAFLKEKEEILAFIEKEEKELQN